MLVSQASPVRLLSELISGVEADEMLHSWMLMRLSARMLSRRAGRKLRLSPHRKDKINMKRQGVVKEETLKNKTMDREEEKGNNEK